ncbi:MAG: hypothetical protein ACOYMN_03985, partial [Roseimicrobium sp.]
MNPIRNPQSTIRNWLCIAVLLSSFVIPHSSFGAESPLYIPFQGQVTNQAGVLATDGQYSVIFNLYDQAVGGQPVWSERHVKIGVTRGMINVFLGSISPLTSVDFSQTKYLGITVDTDNLATTADPEMVPRSLIMPAFWAKRADKATDSTKLVGADWSSFIVNGTGIALNDPASGFIRGDKLASASVTQAQLATGAVGSAQLASSSVTSSAVQAGAIGSTQLQDGGVTSIDIAAGAVTPNKLAPVNFQISSTTSTFLCDGASTSVVVPALNVTITSTGRPLVIGLISDGNDAKVS